MPDKPHPRRMPARTFEAEEDRIIDKAYRLAERQIDEGTVSSQVLSHWLKLGSSREKLEQARLRTEIQLNETKNETVSAQKNFEEIAKKAYDALSSYQGRPPLTKEDLDEYDD